MMTVSMCGTVSALTLGLPASAAFGERRGRLPKQALYAKAPLSTRLRKAFTDDVAETSMLALLRPDTLHCGPGTRTREILVLGIRLASHDLSPDVLDFIASRRTTDMAFVLVRDRPAETPKGDTDAADSGTGDLQCAVAVRRAVPVKPGRQPRHQVYIGGWRSADDARINTRGDTMDQVWDSLCAGVILDSDDGTDLDARIARRDQAATLESAIAKLERDHARAKTPAQRNEIYARLHKARRQLDELRQSKA